MKRALITGITGQDGSYLAEFLIAKGYEVHGIVRRSSQFNTGRIDHIYKDLHEADVRLILHHGDMADASVLNRIVRKVKPDEIYNLAAQSHVRVSFDMPEYTTDIVAMGTLRLLDSLIESGLSPRFYQASSSEMYGNSDILPQTESTPFKPESPYACAKVFAHNLVSNYRDAYKLFACNGILFNHESPRRGETFVTRKITRAIARIVVGKQDYLHLGNLEARRDWGFAGDYVEAMWRMLQADKPEDYVIATGESHSVREFLELAFGIVKLDWKRYVKTDSRYLRPTEVHELRGDMNKAREKLKWQPKVSFKELVHMMVEEDLKQEGLDPAKTMA